MLWRDLWGRDVAMHAKFIQWQLQLKTLRWKWEMKDLHLRSCIAAAAAAAAVKIDHTDRGGPKVWLSVRQYLMVHIYAALQGQFFHFVLLA